MNPPLSFSLLVQGNPWSGESCHNALRIAKACIDSGQSIYRVFFYQDAVLCGSAYAHAPQGQRDIAAQWQTLQSTHGLDLVLCIGSAVKRGLLDAEEAKRYEKPGSSMLGGFRLGGLGEWLEATVEADRCLSFGD